MKYLLTYEDAQAIVAKYNNHQFWESNFKIDGYKLATFNYFLCGANDFENPLGEDSDINAFDMRGTTFTFDLDGKLVDTFYMLPKFFNLNQVESTQYNLVKAKKIVNVSVKEDGSLIGIMRLPNKKLFCKTMGGFDNDQSIAAYDLIHQNSNNVTWINDLIDFGYTPLFEYVSFDNRIVLKYTEKQLRYIGFRDNLTGDFIPANSKLAEGLFCEDIPDTIVSISTEDFTLDELISKSETEENKEGWVIMFEDGQLIKTKTQWYFLNHKLRDDITRENKIIEMIINGNIDDFISTIDSEEYRKRLEKIENIVNLYINKKIKEVRELIKKYDGDRKKFVISNKGNKNLGFALSYLFNNKKIINVINEYLLNRTKKLKKAIEFIDKGVI